MQLYLHSVVMSLRLCAERFEDCQTSKLHALFPTSQRTNSVSSTETKCLIMFKEIVGSYGENDTKQSTLSVGKMQNF
jgi:hypothetical protein